MENPSVTNPPTRRLQGGKRVKVDPERRKRSAVTNGTKAFIEGDGNSPWYRRYKDLVAGHVTDLGGTSLLSKGQISLCRRAAVLEVELERMEGKLSMGETGDLDLYNRTVGNLRRVLETIGLKRVAKTVKPTLQQFIELRAEAIEAEEANDQAD